MAQHSALTDPYLHEPKGVAAATAGKVYVADGAGSGTWALLIPSQTGNAGEFLTTDGSTLSWATITGGPVARATITNGSAASPTIGTGAVNIASITWAAGLYTITFTTPLASTNYQLIVSPRTAGGFTDNNHGSVTNFVDKVTFNVYRDSGTASYYNAFDFVIFGGT